MDPELLKEFSMALIIPQITGCVSGNIDEAAILTARLESAPYRTMMNVPAALELESARRPFFTVSTKLTE